jgi:hypothetical protein
MNLKKWLPGRAGFLASVAFLRLIMVTFVVAVLFGCAANGGMGGYRVSSWGIVTGKARPAINPDEVEVYSDPPSQYETIGLVEACGAPQMDDGWATQEMQDAIINELKEQSAKIGANGVIVVDIGTRVTTSGGGSGRDGNISVDVSSLVKKTAKGRAIYVAKEEEPVTEPARDTDMLPDSAKEEGEASP